MTNDFFIMVLTVFKDHGFFSLSIVIFFAFLFIIKNSDFDFTIKYRPSQKD